MRTGTQKIFRLNLGDRATDSNAFRVPEGWRVVSMTPVGDGVTIYVVLEQVLAEDRL